MFIPVRRNVFRWGTPDPESDFIMFGHLIVGESGCILVDPPMVPDLLDYIGRLGKVEAVILTTHDHTRGAAHIAEQTGATLYLPDQTIDDVSPRAMDIHEQVSGYERYAEGNVLSFRAYRLKVDGDRRNGMPSMNEFALFTDRKELIVGDFAVGSEDGNLLVAPEWFPGSSRYPPYGTGRKLFKDLVRKTGATSLLASHGQDLFGNLGEQAEKL